MSLMQRTDHYLCPREEAFEAEDMAAAVGEGELASSQDTQTDGTPLCLLSIHPFRWSLAT